MAYQPKQGDIIVIDFDPQAGHEQKGRRPCVVVSNDQLKRKVSNYSFNPQRNPIPCESRYKAVDYVDGNP
ncbi:type II toxin-antitoxin system PemK/MazF family toxin [Treponema sp. R80B11-R83G3]